MNPDKEDPSPEPEQRKSLLARFAALVSFGKPETKEELELEIQELLEEGEDRGLIGAVEEKMINSVLDFRNTLADEIMTPAVDILSVPVTIPLDELIDRVIDSGFTRVPVYRGGLDHIIGLIHAKDLLKICARQRDQPFRLEEHLLPVHVVGENKPIIDLLREFQQKKAHMAIVTDEFGAVRGLLTMEDIIEEIFGEIDDEHDDEEEPIEH
ncbi:MAG: CBS domain-containing protein, partial [Desulfobulbaceae bacterium]|nr:CBS domain-containing protein [Desulfobulbaceae bacterium]